VTHTRDCTHGMLSCAGLARTNWRKRPCNSVLTGGLALGGFVSMRTSGLWVWALTVTLCVAAPGTALPLSPGRHRPGPLRRLGLVHEGGADLGFAGRRQLLEPEIRKALDLPLMTRLVVGPLGRALPRSSSTCWWRVCRLQHRKLCEPVQRILRRALYRGCRDDKDGEWRCHRPHPLFTKDRSR